MHELSLAQGLLGQLHDLAEKHGAERIIRASVSIGKDSGIVVDSFRFGFDVLRSEAETTKGAVLEIIETEGSDLLLMQVEME